MKYLCLLSYLLLAQVHAEAPIPKPHPVPKLADLYKPWVFARASEASTLFIEPHFKGSEPYGHLVKTADALYWFEFDGKKSDLWVVTEYKEADKQLELHLENGSRVLIFPYWDIDHCLLIIRKDSKLENNPTRFSVPYTLLPSIPYLEGE